jgi:YesN/AraC family two-component response regulator
LIADDEMMNIFGLKIILKMLGIDNFSILTAINGQEALDIFQDYLHNKSQEY